MKLFAVIQYHPARFALFFPMFYFISEDKTKCESYIKELKNDKIYAKMYSIIEIETDKNLNYLIEQEIW